MASTSGGTFFSPQALDPYPVETELAKTAYDRVNQQQLMDQYWFERQANKNLYGQEIEQNRQLQQQQMANALREKYLGLLKEAGTVPGVAEVISGPLGIDPTKLAANAAAEADSEHTQRYGSAASSLSNAGVQPPDLTSRFGIPFGTRPDITIEGMRSAAQLAAARIRAAASGEAGIGTNIQGPPQPILGGMSATFNVPSKYKGNAQDVANALRAKGYVLGSDQELPPSQKGGITGLGPKIPPGTTMAQQDTPANNKTTPQSGGSQTFSDSTIKQMLDQKLAQSQGNKQAQAIYNDIMAYAKQHGGRFEQRVDETGNLRIRGASGKEW